MTDQPQKLIDILPREFANEYSDTHAWHFRNETVIEKVDGRERAWPGPHKHVLNWYILADGHIVGWNENPARGWSFPVMRMKAGPNETDSGKSFFSKWEDIIKGMEL
jgi:hypothetical protein